MRTTPHQRLFGSQRTAAGAAVKLTTSRLFGVAAVLGGVAACIWPVAIVLTRVGRIHCRVGPDGFEAEWELADEAQDRGGES